MFVVRLLVLSFLAAYSVSMGKIPSHELNAFGVFISMAAVVFVPALYMLPTIEAWLKSHPNIASIALVNFFLGWTLVGWVVAVVWAFKKAEPQVTPPLTKPYEPMFATAEAKKFKVCPFCAEDVLLAAIKCKHCGSDLEK
ncbi:hypothetical protein PS662_04387 [Pseudomonas fluorescens]|uniref:Superinfection immunity protein n=1 Tax=Pseudomonas fluorescens TaxID=294 RepID=A0A5E6VU11_PSEFL|nr:superinfection immunity protein [Pseudomonas fluorescens]VVN21410.1 hypothetical protein PS662_04387 [Pseudomonas fluorescens]